MSHLALIGYRGVGKTTVSSLLGEMLQQPAVDADVYLEQQTGRTIREIFEDDGETEFRQLEARLLAELLDRSEPSILALGGGVVLLPENRQRLAEVSVVWLQCDPRRLAERLAQDATTDSRRPALTSHNGYDEIVTLLARRTPLYREVADLIVDTADKRPAEIAESIARWYTAL